MIKNRLPFLALFIFLTLTFFAYQPGISGFFFFDDSTNILENTSLHIKTLDWTSLQRAALSGFSGILGRPISMLSFALDYLLGDLNPGQYKITNIIIHLLNGICVFTLSRLLLKTLSKSNNNSLNNVTADWISALVAAAWLLHPINMSSVLYIVQRMTSLSSLFSFLGLIFYIHGRLTLTNVNQHKPWLYIIASFIIFIPLSILSKENGALLPVFLLLTELVFFHFETPSKRSKQFLKLIYIVTLLIPLLAILGYTVLHPEWINNTYKLRTFSLSERLMTEARVIWFYIRLIFVPDITTLGMHHDDVSISRSLLDPISTIPACLGIFTLLFAGIFSYKKYPIAAYGILFFLVGHSMESSFIALELIHEHRNYLPSFGIIFALSYYLFAPGKHNESTKIRYLLAVVCILMLASITWLRANQWGDGVGMKLKEVEHHPKSIRANIDIAAFYGARPATNQIEANELYSEAYGYYVTASSLSPSDTNGLFGLVTMHSMMAMPLEATWIDALSYRLRTYPFTVESGNSIDSLAKCALGKRCKDAEEITETLFKAALSNPSLSGRSRIQVLFSWSEWVMKVKHDNKAALIAAKEAASIEPNDIDMQLNLLAFLINLDLHDEAKAQFKMIQSLDKLGLHRDELRAVEKLVVRVK